MDPNNNAAEVAVAPIEAPESNENSAVAVAAEEMEIKPSEQETGKKSWKSKFSKKGKKADSEYSSDVTMVIAVYSSICGIGNVYTLVLPVVQAGVEASFWMVIVIGLLFTYSIILIVIGLRPRDATMVDTILGDLYPKAKIYLVIMGQFTSGWMMALNFWLGGVLGSQGLQASFSVIYSVSPKLPAAVLAANKAKNTKIIHNCCIINIFIAIFFSMILNPRIFVPLQTLPTYGTIYGVCATIWWVDKNTGKTKAKLWAKEWGMKSGNWAESTSAGLTAMFVLVGNLASSFYLHSMIQQVLQRAKYPEHNVRNTIMAFCIAIVTILFTNLVCALPWADYFGPNNQGDIALPDNLLYGMGTSGPIRADNLIIFFTSLPSAALQWAVFRQSTTDRLPWSKIGAPNKTRIPIIFTVQTIMILIAFGFGWGEVNVQIMVQVASFPASIYWVCFMPALYHILMMTKDPVRRHKWSYPVWIIADVLASFILFFCEIVQFIPSW